MKKVHIISALVLLLPAVSFAQRSEKDTTIKGATIEIIQSYKPEVKRAPRPEPAAYLPPVDTTSPAVQYTVPSQTLFYSYGALPLKPLALDISAPTKTFENYIKMGGGNLSTISFDAGISSLKGDNYTTNIQAHHLSQKGDINYQKVSLTGIDASGELRSKGKVFGALLDVAHNRYNNYGYDQATYIYPADSVQQAFTRLSVNLDMQDEPMPEKNFHYHPFAKAGMFYDQRGASETAFNIGLPLSYDVDSNLSIYLDADAALATLNNDAGTQNNNIVRLGPGLRFTSGIFKGHASVSAAWGNSGATYALPDAEVSFMLPKTQFIFNAGWKGSLLQNSYQQLATTNPYMSNLYTIVQTHTNELYGGIKSNIGSHITFNGRLSWWEYNNLPMFVNDTLSDKRQFVLLYDTRVNALGLQAGIRYQVAETFSVGLNAQWLSFYQKTYEHVWHRPGIRFMGDMRLEPIEKLTISVYSSFMDELYALDKGSRSVKLSSILDIGAGAEYKITERINIFLQTSNLLNAKYQLWYGYDAFGLNVYGGVRLKF